MPPSREDDQEPTRKELVERIVTLERELHRLRCEYRRVCSEADWKDEQIRVYRRVIERLGDRA